MPTASEIYERNRSLFGTVPEYQLFSVCNVCRGPVVNYASCYGCKVLAGAADFELAGSVAPMSVAPNPGPWYSRLAKYKTFQPEYRPVLASLVYLFLVTHAKRIEEVLGGEFDHLTVVPSTRGIKAENQPLRHILSLMKALEEHAATLVRHVVGRGIARQTYAPDAFSCDGAVRGRRILLLEDTWVTGAKAVSAAGALYRAGAASVLILPIARMVQPGSGYYPEDLPYFSLMKEEHDLSRWPL